MKKVNKFSFDKAYNSAEKSCQNAYATAKTAVGNSVAIRPIIVAILAFIIGFNAGHIFLPIKQAEATTPVTETTEATEATTKSTKSAPEKAETTAPVTTAKTTYATTQSITVPDTTSAGIPTTGLYIPSVGIYTSVVASSLQDNTPTVPSSGASKYGSLIMGHVFGIFANLSATAAGQKLYLNGETYTITSVERNLPVSSDRRLVGNYTMGQLIYRGDNNLVLMTCAGSYNANINTYSHRTLVFATR
ncbi:class F sortase [Candidatus Saccharibacteria bacterium]|nr:class F sortase [Candidatus Saccharibacteria bacterium]